jgi:Ca2+-binding EF-hand superfamily protein
MYIMTKKRRRNSNKKTRKKFKLVKKHKRRLKARGRKFRRTFRKRRGRLNLRFKTLRRRGGAAKSHAKSVAKKQKKANTLHKVAAKAQAKSNASQKDAKKKEVAAAKSTATLKKKGSAAKQKDVKNVKDKQKKASDATKKAVTHSKDAEKKKTAANQAQKEADKAKTSVPHTTKKRAAPAMTPVERKKAVDKASNQYCIDIFKMIAKDGKINELDLRNSLKPGMTRNNQPDKKTKEAKEISHLTGIPLYEGANISKANTLIKKVITTLGKKTAGSVTQAEWTAYYKSKCQVHGEATVKKMGAKTTPKTSMPTMTPVERKKAVDKASNQYCIDIFKMIDENKDGKINVDDLRKSLKPGITHGNLLDKKTKEAKEISHLTGIPLYEGANISKAGVYINTVIKTLGKKTAGSVTQAEWTAYYKPKCQLQGEATVKKMEAAGKATTKSTDACNPFAVTKVSCGPALKKEFHKEARLCHPDKNADKSNADLDFQTLQVNYKKQENWCKMGPAARRASPRPGATGKEEWDCKHKKDAKWDKETKKCVSGKKGKGKGKAACKENKDCKSNICATDKCTARAPLGKPCKEKNNCLSDNCYTGTDGKSICKQGAVKLGRDCETSEQCITNACAGTTGNRKCVKKIAAPSVKALGFSVLTAAVAKGATTLLVAKPALFHKGDVVRIGNSGGEVRTVTSATAVVLNQKLDASYPKGTKVTIIAHAHSTTAKPSGSADLGSSVLTADIKAGATKIPVSNNKLFHKGDVVRIGKVPGEVRSVVGYGSILINQPLDTGYPKGTKVTIIAHAHSSKVPTKPAAAPSKKKQGEKCANNKDCISNVCDVTLHTCSAKEAAAAIHAKQKEEATPKKAIPKKAIPPGTKEKVTLDVALTDAAQKKILDSLRKPADAHGNRIVILKITGEQIGPSGAGQAVVRASGGLKAPVAVAATAAAVGNKTSPTVKIKK